MDCGSPRDPGLGSDGRTREEALKNVRETAESSLLVRKDLNLPLVAETAYVEVTT